MCFKVARDEKGNQVINIRKRIIAIEILDENLWRSKEPVRQYVNLPKDSKWLDKEKISDYQILNLYRLGRNVRAKVRFNGAGQEKFYFRLLPGLEELNYSDTEKSHKENYKYAPENWEEKVTDADGTKEIEVQVSAAGGQTFRIEAKDDYGSTVFSRDIVCWRRIYVQEIKMRKKDGKIIAMEVYEIIKREMVKHYIEVIRLEDTIMNYKPFEVTNDFRDAIRSAYKNSQAPEFEPYVITIVHLDTMGDKARIEIRYPDKGEISIGPKSPDLLIPIIDTMTGKSKFLWLGEKEYDQHWLRYGLVITSKNKIEIPEENFVLLPVNSSRCDKLKVKVSNLTNERVKGNIYMEVLVVDNMFGGEAAGVAKWHQKFGDSERTNLIFMSTLFFWKKISPKEFLHALLHEIGHMMGLVPDGTGDLERSPTFYENRGHNGPHCHSGLPLKEKFDTENDPKLSKCLMFGAGLVERPALNFCEYCLKALRKIDLSKGWRIRF